MHAARDRPTRVRSAGFPLGGGCGSGSHRASSLPVRRLLARSLLARSCAPGPCTPGLAEGGRASSRSIFASCSVRRVSCSSARLICSCACASRSSAPPVRASRGSVSFGSGVEFIGVSLSVQCHPRRPVDEPLALQFCPNNDGRILTYAETTTTLMRRGRVQFRNLLTTAAFGSFDEMRTRGRRLEPVGEILGFAGYQPSRNSMMLTA